MSRPIHSEAGVRTWFAKVVLPTREVWVTDIDATVVALLVLHNDLVDQL